MAVHPIGFSIESIGFAPVFVHNGTPNIIQMFGYREVFFSKKQEKSPGRN